MDIGFCGLIVCFSMALIIPGCVLFWVNHRRKKRYSGVAQGKIIRFEQVYANGGTLPHPVYEYFVDGSRYSKQGAHISHANLEVGMPISVLYDPNCPSKACIKGYDSNIYSIVGAVLVGLGILLMLMVFSLLFILFAIQ